MSPEEIQSVLEDVAHRIAAFDAREKAAREAILQAEMTEVFDEAEEERRHRQIDERLLREAV